MTRDYRLHGQHFYFILSVFFIFRFEITASRLLKLFSEDDDFRQLATLFPPHPNPLQLRWRRDATRRLEKLSDFSRAARPADVAAIALPSSSVGGGGGDQSRAEYRGGRSRYRSGDFLRGRPTTRKCVLVCMCASRGRRREEGKREEARRKMI